jgi:hypothetical protein
MSSKTAVNAIACPPGTLAGGPVRTRFFDGMFLTQADLETEQRFWRIKRRLTNRALGEGAVWGLRLDWKPAKHSFSLTPGYALDCCGNDLVVVCPIEISEAQLWQRADPSLRPGGDVVTPVPAGTGKVAPEGDRVMHACVVLQYVECAEEARPVHRDACAGPTGYCEPSRVRESARLLLVPPPAARPLTSPELFLEELYKWRDSLSPAMRAVLFPDPGTPPVLPGSGLAPLTVRVSLGATQVDIPVPASGSTTVPLSPATQTPAAGRPTGVVTFELLPSSGWHLASGRVMDATRVVETVTPPASPSMYWALDVALPESGASSGHVDFEFLIDNVELVESFGGSQHGRVRARITGIVTVTPQQGADVEVVVDKLTVTTELAEVFEDEGDGCLRELVPWGWTVDPANGQNIASTLVLASLYAFLSEVTQRNSDPRWRILATELYSLAWLLLFGVDSKAGPPASEVERAKLAQLILGLFKRWCEGFAYPGPRCFDEHHGVYLGCLSFTSGGAIQSFDMWEHRRYVLTGPLLNHWGAQFGIAPLDVIVGRFAGAMCCLSGLPPIALPEMTGTGGPVGGMQRIYVGDVNSIKAFGEANNSDVSWVSVPELMVHLPRAFVEANTSGPVDVIAAQVSGGMSIALAKLRPMAQVRQSGLLEDVTSLLRRGDLKVRESARGPAAEFTVAILRAAPAEALLDGASPATRDFAARLRSATTATVAEIGTAGVVRLAGRGDTSDAREAAADLVEKAEAAVDAVAGTVVRVLGPRFDRSAFSVPANQTRLAEELRRAIPGIAAAAVKTAADQVARR